MNEQADAVKVLRELMVKASKGPWSCERSTSKCTDGRDFFVHDKYGRYVCGIGRIKGMEQVHGNLIASARTHLPAILDELEDLHAFKKFAKESIDLQHARINELSDIAEQAALAGKQVAGELEAARAVIAKLPRTADGVPVTPGMTVYFQHFGSVISWELTAVAAANKNPEQYGYSTEAAALAAQTQTEGAV